MKGGRNGCCAAGFDDSGSQTARILELAIKIEHVGQLLFGVVVDHVGCREAGIPVHAHVERRVIAEGKTAAAFVEVMARHTQVCQQAVNVVDVIVAHPVAEIPEVTPHKSEAILVGWQVDLAVAILVESK